MSNNIKEFQIAVASHILGKKTNVRVKGSPEKIKVVSEVIEASKSLYNELNNKNATMERISELLNKKRLAAKEFQDKLGTPWML